MSTLILPRSIRRSNAADNAQVDQFHEDAAYESAAREAGIQRTVKWAHTSGPGSAGYHDGDTIIAVRVPGRERVIHKRPEPANQSGMKIRVYDCTTPRPCPGCGKNLYGIGEIQTEFAPWHLACWELEQTMREMAGELAIEFDAHGLPVVAGTAKGRGRPRRRRR